MELTRRPRRTTCVSLLASTAVIALLSACQSSGSGTGASAAAPGLSSSDGPVPSGCCPW
jgi:hypothetical protein